MFDLGMKLQAQEEMGRSGLGMMGRSFRALLSDDDGSEFVLFMLFNSS